MTKSLSADLPDSSAAAKRLYQAVWRWHFYAGLWVIPFMLILAITGIIYLFRPQLDTLMYRDLMFVQPTAAAVSYTQQVEAVQQAYPGSVLTKVIPPVADNRSSEIQIAAADNQNLMVFVNPYTEQVLGTRDENRNLQAIARTLHGELMIGRWGDYLVELAACWSLVLLISGLYLWLPRRGFSPWGTLIPRWGQGRRIFWRDLHAVPGFYGTLLIGFLILTGLPWSGFWGDTFANVWGRFPAHMWEDVPQSTLMTQRLNQHGEQVVPWAVEKLPLPRSVLLVHTHGGQMPAAAPAPVSLDQVVATAQAHNAPAGYSISLPEGETGVYTVSAFPNDPAEEITLHIDQYSGQVLAAVGWQDYGLVPKAVEMGIAIHMGKYFGLANQLLMLLACLILIGLSLSGVVMWWQRRPSGRLGAPPFPVEGNQWKVPVAIAAVLGIVFPLVGLSLVVVLLLDYLVIARIPTLKRLLN
jgi:uncharacterized iron-regulated membrane protein